jgi:ArsR family transcriptional regulator
VSDLSGDPSDTSGIPRAALLFHALGDERRLRILRLLASGERCVCDLTEALAAAQPLLSFHLKELKKAGLVIDRRQGRWSYYSLRPEAVREIESLLAALTTPDPASAPCCAPASRGRTKAAEKESDEHAIL